jgi:hypothetical protein
MAGNVLWTNVFNQQGNQSQELTRQRIVQHERCGRRPATVTPGPEYDKLVRGQGKLLDPWAPPPDTQRSKIEPPLVGYGGTVPMLRPEHTGKNRGEQAAHFVPHFGSNAHAKMRREAPAGGASALGTKPFESKRRRAQAALYLRHETPCAATSCQTLSSLLTPRHHTRNAFPKSVRLLDSAVPGTRTPPGVGIYDALLVARAADPFTGKPQ